MSELCALNVVSVLDVRQKSYLMGCCGGEQVQGDFKNRSRRVVEYN